MATLKQIEANRVNAQKSTGAKTEAGKKTCRLNATKHGLLNSDLSKHEALKIEAVRDTLCEDFKPNSVLEEFVIERIAVHTLKLKRIAKAEAGYINNYFNSRLLSVDIDGEEKHLGSNSITELLKTYSRYEITEENRLYKAIRELYKLWGV